jgi:hypothetical protein
LDDGERACRLKVAHPSVSISRTAPVMRLLRALLPIVIILPAHPLIAQRDSLPRAAGVRVDSIVPGPEDRAAASTVTELIRGRAAGLNVRESGGTVGAAPRLWIRGPSSVMLRNDPLVVVDGVRIVSDPDALTIGVGGAGTSRLEDIDPNDVQRVRVLRGPAATAVYGPEAAAGAIEITTRGAGPGGGPRFQAWSGLGARSDVTEYPANFARPGSSGTCPLQLEARAGCTPTGPIVSFNPLEEASPFRTGRSSLAGLALRGTAPGGIGYALSGGVEDAEGVLDRNHRELRSLRGSVGYQPVDGVRLALTAAHVRRETALPFGDQSQFGRIGAGLGGFAVDDPTSRGYRGIPLRDTFYHNTESVRHSTLGASAEWRTPLRWLSLGVHASRDQADADERSSLTRLIAGTPTTTRVGVELERARSTAGGRLTAAWSRWGALRGEATVGAERLGWTVQRVVDDGSTTLDSLRAEQPDVGVYLRSGVRWREAVALSVAVRRDEPSRTEQTQWSYSAGGEWALDREPWFPARIGVSGLRLRAAYGETERGLEARVGLPPGPCFDACPPQPRTETLAEREGGVDLELFRGAVSVGVTSYRRETRHLVGLLPVGLEGAPQFLSMGRLHNRGLEVQAGLRGGREDFVRWEVQAAGASNRNRVEADEDGFIPFSPAFGTANRHGRPLGSYFFRSVLRGEDRDGDGIIEVCTGTSVCEVQLSTEEEYLGSSLPDRLGSLAGTVRLGGAVSLYARADYQGGARLLDLTSNLRCTTRSNCRAAYDPATPPAEQARVVASLQGSRAGFVHDADFVRLREVAVTLSAPRRWTRRFGAAGVDLTVGGRNLAIWTDYPGLDPEVNAAGPEVTAAYDLNPQPPVRMWTTRVDVRF